MAQKDAQTGASKPRQARGGTMMPRAAKTGKTAKTPKTARTAKARPVESRSATAAAAKGKVYPFVADLGRAANMRGNRRTDTKPELALRAALHARGYRYRKDLRLDLPLRRVRPDIAFTSRKVAVFVDGCFWHACPEHGSKPKNNEWYWSPKLVKNVERDRAADAALEAAGWTVVRLWEHVPLDDAVAAVIAAVGHPKAKQPQGSDSNHSAGGGAPSAPPPRGGAMRGRSPLVYGGHRGVGPGGQAEPSRLRGAPGAS